VVSVMVMLRGRQVHTLTTASIDITGASTPARISERETDDFGGVGFFFFPRALFESDNRLFFDLELLCRT